MLTHIMIMAIYLRRRKKHERLTEIKHAPHCPTQKERKGAAPKAKQKRRPLKASTAPLPQAYPVQDKFNGLKNEAIKNIELLRKRKKTILDDLEKLIGQTENNESAGVYNESRGENNFLAQKFKNKRDSCLKSIKEKKRALPQKEEELISTLQALEKEITPEEFSENTAQQALDKLQEKAEEINKLLDCLNDLSKQLEKMIELEKGRFSKKPSLNHTGQVRENSAQKKKEKDALLTEQRTKEIERDLERDLERALIQLRAARRKPSDSKKSNGAEIPPQSAQKQDTLSENKKRLHRNSTDLGKKDLATLIAIARSSIAQEGKKITAVPSVILRFARLGLSFQIFEHQQYLSPPGTLLKKNLKCARNNIPHFFETVLLREDFTFNTNPDIDEAIKQMITTVIQFNKQHNNINNTPSDELNQSTLFDDLRVEHDYVLTQEQLQAGVVFFQDQYDEITEIINNSSLSPQSPQCALYYEAQKFAYAMIGAYQSDLAKQLTGKKASDLRRTPTVKFSIEYRHGRVKPGESLDQHIKKSAVKTTQATGIFSPRPKPQQQGTPPLTSNKSSAFVSSPARGRLG